MDNVTSHQAISEVVAFAVTRHALRQLVQRTEPPMALQQRCGPQHEKSKLSAIIDLRCTIEFPQCASSQAPEQHATVTADSRTGSWDLQYSKIASKRLGG